MQRGKDQVAAIGSLEREVQSFPVRNGAEENHMRRVTQRRAQSHGKARHVAANFALQDGGLAMAELEFHGVLNGDDVPLFLFADLAEDRGQRGRLPRADRATHHYEPAAKMHKAIQLRGKVEGLEGWNGGVGDDSQLDGVAAALREDIHAEAA